TYCRTLTQPFRQTSCIVLCGSPHTCAAKCTGDVTGFDARRAQKLREQELRASSNRCASARALRAVARAARWRARCSARRHSLEALVRTALVLMLALAGCQSPDVAADVEVDEAAITTIGTDPGHLGPISPAPRNLAVTSNY